MSFAQLSISINIRCQMCFVLTSIKVKLILLAGLSSFFTISSPFFVLGSHKTPRQFMYGVVDLVQFISLSNSSGLSYHLIICSLLIYLLEWPITYECGSFPVIEVGEVSKTRLFPCGASGIFRL